MLNLDEIEAYCEKATSGPWIAFDRQISKQRGELILQGLHSKDDDLKFCARARTDLPLAVEELREARAEIERLKTKLSTRTVKICLNDLPRLEPNIYIDDNDATKGEG